MNKKHLYAVLCLLTASTMSAKYYDYPQAKPTFHPAAQQYVNPYHTMMKNLAANPALAHNPELVANLLDYVNQLWPSSEKRDIMQALASNPNACTNPQLAHLVQEEILYQRKQSKLEAMFALGTLAAVGIGFIVYTLTQSISAHYTH